MFERPKTVSSLDLWLSVTDLSDQILSKHHFAEIPQKSSLLDDTFLQYTQSDWNGLFMLSVGAFHYVNKVNKICGFVADRNIHSVYTDKWSNFVCANLCVNNHYSLNYLVSEPIKTAGNNFDHEMTTVSFMLGGIVLCQKHSPPPTPSRHASYCAVQQMRAEGGGLKRGMKYRNLRRQWQQGVWHNPHQGLDDVHGDIQSTFVLVIRCYMFICAFPYKFLG